MYNSSILFHMLVLHYYIKKMWFIIYLYSP